MYIQYKKPEELSDLNKKECESKTLNIFEIVKVLYIIFFNQKLDFKKKGNAKFIKIK